MNQKNLGYVKREKSRIAVVSRITIKAADVHFSESKNRPRRSQRAQGRKMKIFKILH